MAATASDGPADGEAEGCVRTLAALGAGGLATLLAMHYSNDAWRFLVTHTSLQDTPEEAGILTYAFGMESNVTLLWEAASGVGAAGLAYLACRPLMTAAQAVYAGVAGRVRR